MKLYVIVS